MKKTVLLISIFFSMTLVVFLDLPAEGYTYSDYDWKTYNDHQYAITLDYSNWTQAESWAIEVGGHLVTINDAAETDWLSYTFQGYYSRNGYGDHNRSLVWIGLEWIGDQWRWVSGEPVTFLPPCYGDDPTTQCRDHGGIHAYLHTDTHHRPGTWWEDTIYDGDDPSWHVRGIIELSEPAIEAVIDIYPDTLNLTSRGRWITCYIWLPEGYDVAAIDPDTILLEGELEAAWSWIDEEEQVLMVKFSRSEVQEMLQPGEIELTVTGELLNGTKFEGSDTVRVIDKG